MPLTSEVTKWDAEQLKAHGINLDAPPSSRLPRARPEDFPNTTAAEANIESGLVVEWVSINTTDGHSGSGWGFGIGEGLDVTAGVLSYGSWDTLRSAENDTVIVAELDVLTITFLIDSNPVAVFVGAGVGEITFEGYGSFNWN